MRLDAGLTDTPCSSTTSCMVRGHPRALLALCGKVRAPAAVAHGGACWAAKECQRVAAAALAGVVYASRAALPGRATNGACWDNMDAWLGGAARCSRGRTWRWCGDQRLSIMWCDEGRCPSSVPARPARWLLHTRRGALAPCACVAFHPGCPAWAAPPSCVQQLQCRGGGTCPPRVQWVWAVCSSTRVLTSVARGLLAAAHQTVCTDWLRAAVQPPSHHTGACRACVRGHVCHAAPVRPHL